MFVAAIAYTARATTVIDLRGRLRLDVVNTEATRELGLGGRSSLARDQGMLFTFDTSGIYPFWMKGMKFPIDIVWIDKGTVKDVVTLHEPKDETSMPEWHAPTSFADRVLEINAGEAKTFGLSPGVRVLLPE
jgi:hypothetical protein